MLPKLLPRHHGLTDTIKYLFAVGDHLAHTDPHLVAAWDTTLLEFPDTVRPGTVERRELVRRLDAPRRQRDKHVKAGHVLHVPISAHSDDGLLGDKVWRELAEEFVTRLGLAGCRWVAVHHGTSKSGNDHIHLVVQLVGEDGRVARLDHSKRKARAWALEVEQRLGLVRTGRSGTGARELTRAEHERATRTGVEPQRRTLERRVRAAATSSHNPGEFVESLQRAGVHVDLVLDEGNRRVVGYTVALDEGQVLDGGPVLRLAGGQLARDLTTGELVDRWRAALPPLGSTDDSAQAGDLLAEHRATRDRSLVQYLTSPHEWRPRPPDRPLRPSGVRYAEAKLHDALTLLDTLVDGEFDRPVDAARRHHVLDQAAGIAAVVSVLVPVRHVDDQGRRVDQDARAVADHLAAAARLSHPTPTRRPARRPDPLLPELASVARTMARAVGDPELALLLLVMVVLAVLIIAVSEWFASRARGEAGAHVHAAADRLRPYEADAATLRTPRSVRRLGSTGQRQDPAVQVLDDGRQRVARAQVRLAERAKVRVDPNQSHRGGRSL
ncbi:relaxase/mobilization nuclease domain-containing protein [Saccharothrix deserti]|uniref:relaxase/mobilization nuclease domain-containing protein n=1 Tax=Saccharothrix deserti TaxID=2593674 RepID=UPI00131D1AEB|nr:hypothetical protein [Saccharothrix deserti]